MTMNENMKSYTHIALVLDASGSMGHLRESTIETMKGFFTSLKSDEDKTVVDVWQFDDEVKHLVDGMDLAKGAGEAIEGYSTGGCTALYDAICVGIDELGVKFAAMNEDDRPDAVVFAILTDGFENASSKFTIQDVKARIEHQTQKYSWDFRFLAANQDAVLTGRGMGINDASCLTIDATHVGIQLAADGVANLCCTDVRTRARSTRAHRRCQM